MPSPDETLIDDDAGQAGQEVGSLSLRLVVFCGDRLSIHPLPSSGTVTLGRDETADVRIDSPKVSRRHAVLQLGGGAVLRDEDSVNGTRVRGQVLRGGEPLPVAAGDVIELGDATVVLQRSAPQVAPRQRRLWTHDYFEARLEEECVRRHETGRSFAVLRVHLEGSASPVAVQEELAAVVQPTDLIASYGPGEYEVLLLDASPAQAASLAKRLTAELSDQDAPVRTGLACYPGDGRDPETLLAQACTGIEGERPAAGSPATVVVDPRMRQLYTLVERVAASNISVILLGETGVGKEVVAEAVHRSSRRAAKPFVRLNCAALSESLLESELFGHEKGAFTGALKAKPGLLESASGGSILLDEVGELPMSIQVKLLRVIEQREVLRVGELTPRPIDVRFIAATNRDLEAEVRAGRFRQDLYFRLNGITLVVPALRQRPSEIAPLSRSFIAEACRQADRRPEPSLSPEALTELQRYSWPGNVRELRNMMDRAVLLCLDDTLLPEHLPLEKMRSTPLSSAADAGPEDVAPAPPEPEAEPPSGDPAFQAERQRILDALVECGGNQKLAAKALGISRRTLLTKLDRYAIRRPRKRDAPD